MAATHKRESPKGYRWRVLSRVLAAGLGGYGVSSSALSLLAVLLSRTRGVNPADGVLITTLLSFGLYSAIVIGVFSLRSVLRAWLVLGGAMLVLGAAHLTL